MTRDYSSYMNLIDETIFGNRDEWITPDSFGQWGGTNAFFDEYYPKYKIGKPPGQSDGRFMDYHNAGTIGRAVQDTVALDNAAYVNAANVNFTPILFQGFHNEPLDREHYGEPTDYTAYTELCEHRGSVPIMFQTYPTTGVNFSSISHGLLGIDGTQIWPSDVFGEYEVPYPVSTAIARRIQAYQSNYRYSDPPIIAENDIKYLITCADDEARYALDYEADIKDKVLLPNGEYANKKYVFVESSKSYYYIKDVNKLAEDAGYIYMFNQYAHVTDSNRPIVSFCPKNFILEIRVVTSVVWTDGRTSTARPNALPGYPSGTSTTSSGEPLSEFLSKIPTRLQAIAEYNQQYATGYDYKAQLTVTSVFCYVYSRKKDSQDVYTVVQGGSSPYKPMPNVLFDVVFSLHRCMFSYGEFMNFGFNQHQFTDANTYFTLPLFGTPCSGDNGHKVYSYIPSDEWDRLGRKTIEEEISYWTNHSGVTTSLFSMYEYYYPKSVSGGTSGSFFYTHAEDSIRLMTYIWKVVNDEHQIEVFTESCRNAAASYGLFFCDKYDDLTAKDTPKVWTDEKLMCGTITMDGSVRETWGDYTSGIDNMDQPQFWWVDSEGHTWNPETTFQTNGDDYPTMGSWNMVPLPVMPYPYPIYETANSYPNMAKWDTQLIGAFAGVKSLGSTVIPRTVTEIGYNAFAGTSLTEVTISENCEYSAESFPKNCEVKFYS